MKKFLSSLLLALTVLITASPAHADEPTNTCPNGQILHQYESAVGTVAQNGTPSPANPIEPTFYQQGDMVLRKVGDYADSYDATTGKITRRVGVKVLNGTESWVDYTQHRFTTPMPDTKGQDLQRVYCTHYNGIRQDNAPHVNESCSLFDASICTNCGGLGIKDDRYDGVSGFKSYLAEQYAAGTPVTVWYPLATPVEETPASTTYCADAIKIATTAYNAAAFAPVEAALESAVTTIKDVVANTIVQADAIQNLQDEKQTRPDEDCPAGRLCLLVEDIDGTPHWYPIIERAPGMVPANSGYTQVEYLQSDGHQYIDAGIITKNTEYKIESVFNIKGVTDTEAWAVGMWAGATGNSLRIGVGNSGQWYVQNTTQTYNPNAFALDTKTSATATGTVLAGQKFGIGALYHYQRGFEQTSNIALYSARIYENGDMVFDGVPARRDSDGVLGMYDTVSGTFFTNAGTGEFTTGPAVQ